MQTSSFEELYDRWLNKDSNNQFWTPKLAEEFGYSSTEGLRSAFRRIRRKFQKKEEIKKDTKYFHALGNAKVFVFDIEVSPMLCYAFQLYDDYINPSRIVQDSFMLCWSGKFLNESKGISDVLTPEEAIDGNDKRIVESIWKILNECNILIGHNIKDFDLKKLNVRFLHYGLPPIARSQIIDTLLIAKKNFSFASNSLKYINQFLNIKQKIDNEGFKLWEKCMEGDLRALKTMNDYCLGDVFANEDLYYKLRPFITGHPNLGLYSESYDEVCPNCGSIDIKNEGFYYTPAGKWESMRCEKCGSLSRSKYNELDKEKKKLLKVN